MDLGLKNTCAFITGSSRGIGLAIAEAFLAEGAKVAISARNAATLETARLQLEKRYPACVLAINGDMTNAGAVADAIRRTETHFGPVSSYVANVGTGRVKPGWDVSTDDWQQALQLNLMGGMSLVAGAMPHLQKQKSGSITFISSIAGTEALGAPLTYGAAKAALTHASKGLAKLAGQSGIRVNVVAPGNVLFPGGTWDQKLRENRAQVDAMINSEVPLRRFGSPEEIANCVVFLASPRAAFVTGACWIVDGGQTRGI